ncbi:MAG: isoprenylcysteine carboxylmethyltransferase family protein [Terracidiphilus sp.]|jgi:protein-S-isoprenylcysteine O-methyltransferase Ste14
MTLNNASARTFAILGTAIFFALAPGTVVVLIPWWITHWHAPAHFHGLTLLRFIGAVIIASGAAIIVDSFARFAWQGLGTPAPLYPTRHLVVKGFYRFVRNPMYVSLLLILIGQALLFADTRLLIYALGAWLASHLFVLFYEEPRLRRSFPEDYARFATHVPRWIPRLSPWRTDE